MIDIIGFAVSAQIKAGSKRKQGASIGAKQKLYSPVLHLQKFWVITPVADVDDADVVPSHHAGQSREVSEDVRMDVDLVDIFKFWS